MSEQSFQTSVEAQPIVSVDLDQIEREMNAGRRFAQVTMTFETVRIHTIVERVNPALKWSTERAYKALAIQGGQEIFALGIHPRQAVERLGTILFKTHFSRIA